MKNTKYIAKVKLLLNGGRLKVEPGTVIILGDSDIQAGLNIDNLIKNGGIVPFKSPKQAEAILEDWNTNGRARREGIKKQRRQ